MYVSNLTGSRQILHLGIRERKKLHSKFVNFNQKQTHIRLMNNEINGLLVFLQKYIPREKKIKILRIKHISRLLLKERTFYWCDWVFFHIWGAWLLSESECVLSEKNQYLRLFRFLDIEYTVSGYRNVRDIILNISNFRKDDFIFPVYTTSDGVIDKNVLLDCYLNQVYPLVLTPYPKTVHNVLKSSIDFIYHDLIHLSLYSAAKNADEPNVLKPIIQHFLSIRYKRKFTIFEMNAAFFIIHEVPLPALKYDNYMNYFDSLSSYVSGTLDEAETINFKNIVKINMKNWMLSEIVEISGLSLEKFITIQNNFKVRSSLEIDQSFDASKRLVMSILNSYIRVDSGKPEKLDLNKVMSFIEMELPGGTCQKVKVAFSSLGIKESIFMCINEKNIDEFSIYLSGKKIWECIPKLKNYAYNVLQDWGQLMKDAGYIHKVCSGDYAMKEIKASLLRFIRDFQYDYIQSK